MNLEHEAEQLTCEVGKTLESTDEECQKPAEVEFRGVSLCRSHARELYAKDRVHLWEAMILQLDITLESLNGQGDGNLGRYLELRRADAASELELAREALADESHILKGKRRNY